MTTIKLRRGTAAEWTAANPILAEGEAGFELDTGEHKIGNGIAHWSELPYFLDQKSLDGSFVRGNSSHMTRLVGGVIRNYNDGSGWRLIDDGLHPSINIDSVVSDTSTITVNYPNLFTGTGGGTPRTGTFLAGVDETLAQQGFSVGGSISPQQAILKIGLRVPMSDYLYYDGSSWVLTKADNSPFAIASTATSTITLTHATLLSEEKDAITLTARGGSAIPVISDSSGYGNLGEIKIDFLDPVTRVKLTTPTTGMRVALARGTRGAPIDPSTIHIGSFPQGNIWLLGAHHKAV